jgi:photosystem II stability/assembly factor-like uncharacterized protein
MSIKGVLVAALASLGVALLATPAGANVQVGSSGWQWGNPLPQGNTLRAMSFAGQTGYAAGDFGTLLKTTDGGTTWAGLPVGTFQGLTIVQALDDHTVFAGGGCVARRSTDGGQTFTSVAFTPVESSCRAKLRDMSWVSADLGFLLLDDGSVFTTSDGGTEFKPRTAVPGTGAAGGSARPTSIAFIGPLTGYAATSEGRIFQTLDAGVSWKLVSGPGSGINQLSFFDALHGYAVGGGGLVLRTDDGGQTWSPKNLGAGQPEYTAIRCATAQLCLLSTSGGAQLVRTANGGDAPGTVITPATDPIYAAAFASATRVSAAGVNGSTVVSDDAGVTFTPVGGRLTGSYSALRAGGQHGTAFAPGSAGALAKTLDGGRTWTTGNVPTTAALRDVAFPSADVGYALDRDGGLFRTANGGDTWKTLGTGSTRRPVAVYAPNADVVLVIGPRGLRRSKDGGETFAQVRSRAVLRAALAGVTTGRGGAIFAWGSSALVLSRDRGASWTTLRKPSRKTRIVQVAFSSAKRGLLRDALERIWRTTNGGRRWTLLRAVGTDAITGMAVSSDRAAYLVSDGFGTHDGGYLLHSEDGGATWQPQFVVAAPIAPLGIVATGSVDYVLGGTAELLTSTSGGVAGSESALALATKRRRLPKPAAITVTGRLRPAGDREEVTVSALDARGAWSHETVSVASNGTFATRFHVARGTTTFVAQWAGNFQSAGAGSKVMTVTVGGKAKPRRHAHRKGR